MLDDAAVLVEKVPVVVEVLDGYVGVGGELKCAEHPYQLREAEAIEGLGPVDKL
ncbi:hypothetical protein [Streptomyces sp. NPDC002215]|uniref:hypothetical protein n=1 Tax=Streptomyces sp. NPDC002215 TaxID=3154412 RepID=UPI0033347170